MSLVPEGDPAMGPNTGTEETVAATVLGVTEVKVGNTEEGVPENASAERVSRTSKDAKGTTAVLFNRGTIVGIEVDMIMVALKGCVEVSIAP